MDPVGIQQVDLISKTSWGRLGFGVIQNELQKCQIMYEQIQEFPKECKKGQLELRGRQNAP